MKGKALGGRTGSCYFNGVLIYSILSKKKLRPDARALLSYKKHSIITVIVHVDITIGIVVIIFI